MEESRMPSTGAARALRRALPWLLLVGALAWGLGSYALLDPDEGRNGEVAREMSAGGDFVLPRLDGLPYLDKPVLYFAADALCQRLLGAGETAARLPSLLFALATASLTGWFGGRMFGRRARPIAAVAALAAPLPIAFARTVIFDSALTFFMVLALCAFYLAVAARAARRGYLGWTALAWAAIGLGVLTKGPVALAVPLLAAAPYAIFRRASRAVWHPLGPLLLALCVGPWVWAMSRRVPEFLHYALFTETWQRVTTTEMNREGPLWFFIPCLLAGALPWSVLALAGWRRSLSPRGADRQLPAGNAEPGDWRQRDRPVGSTEVGDQRQRDRFAGSAESGDHRQRDRPAGGAPAGGWWDRGVDSPRLYLALWVVLPFLLFSLSHSKRPQYILPLLPAVAIMAAKVWVDGESDAGAIPGASAAGWTWLGLAVLCAAGPAVLIRVHFARLAHATLLSPTLLGLAAAFLAGAILVLLATRGAGRGGDGPRRGKAEDRDPNAVRPGSGTRTNATGVRSGTRTGTVLLLVGLVLPMAALPALLLPLLGEIGDHRSSRAAAAAIAPRLAPGAEVVAIHSFPPSLPFYLRRTLLVASPRGRELTSNYVIAYFPKWLAADPRLTPLRPAEWWRGALATCDHPLVFVTWADDAANRATLAAAGLPLIVANDRMAAYGPCTAPDPRRP
jgi:4-amino-4-deoxy-L-arabinose transferase-like glycosyltransferase